MIKFACWLNSFFTFGRGNENDTEFSFSSTAALFKHSGKITKTGEN